MIHARKQGDKTGAVIHMLGAASICDDGFMRRMSGMLQESKQFVDAARAQDGGAAIGTLVAERLMGSIQRVEQHMHTRGIQMQEQLTMTQQRMLVEREALVGLQNCPQLTQAVVNMDRAGI